MTTGVWIIIGLVILVTTAAPFVVIYIARMAGTRHTGGGAGGGATLHRGMAPKSEAAYTNETNGGGGV